MFRTITAHFLTIGLLSFAMAGASQADSLRIDGWRCYVESGYQHVVGTVTNTGNSRLESVVAVGVFRSGQGDVIKMADALIDYDPLMPGQSSPFEALTRAHPQIDKCSLSFRTFGGEYIPAVERERGTKQIVDDVLDSLTK